MTLLSDKSEGFEGFGGLSLAWPDVHRSKHCFLEGDPSSGSFPVWWELTRLKCVMRPIYCCFFCFQIWPGFCSVMKCDRKPIMCTQLVRNPLLPLPNKLHYYCLLRQERADLALFKATSQWTARAWLLQSTGRWTFLHQADEEFGFWPLKRNRGQQALKFLSGRLSQTLIRVLPAARNLCLIVSGIENWRLSEPSNAVWSRFGFNLWEAFIKKFENGFYPVVVFCWWEPLWK